MTPVQQYADNRDCSLDELARRYAPMVKRIADHLLCRMPPTVPAEDLIQCGMIKLLEAARTYDGGREAGFQTYASIRVKGAMLDEFRAHAWAPRSAHRRARDITQAMQEIRASTGREAQGREIAERLGITLDEYHGTLEAVSRGKLLSLEELLDGEGGRLEIEDQGVEPEDAVQQGQLTQALAAAIAALPEREQLVVSLYYNDELNFREIGAVLEVTESRVSQIHSQLLLRLRARLADWRANETPAAAPPGPRGKR